MIPELTLVTGSAFVSGTVGATFLLNGMREALLDEVATGSVILLLSWLILQVGGAI